MASLSATPTFASLAEAKEQTGLGMIPLKVALKVFSKQAEDVKGGPSSILTRTGFRRSVRVVMRETKRPEPDDRMRAILDGLFDMFDTDANGTVDMTELGAGLAVLCKGSVKDKFMASFASMDADGDGFISLEEMTSYLTSIKRAFVYLAGADAVVPGMAMSAPAAAAEAGEAKGDAADADAEPLIVMPFGGAASPSEWGAAAAAQCFEVADLNGDGKVSYDEFQKWIAPPSKEDFEKDFKPLLECKDTDWTGTWIDKFSPDDKNPASRRFIDSRGGELQVSADTGGEKWGRRFDSETSVNPVLAATDEPSVRKTSFLSKVPADAPVRGEAEAGALDFTLVLGMSLGQKVIKWNGLYDGKGGKFGGAEAPPSDCDNFWALA